MCDIFNSCIKLSFNKRIENIRESITAFSVVAMEPRFIDSNGKFGPIENINKDVLDVLPDDIDDTSMYIIVGSDMASFRNALKVSVAYDASKGTLSGGGIHIVESFKAVFEPVNLTPKYNHANSHSILATCSKHTVDTAALFSSSYTSNISNVSATAIALKTTYSKVIIDKPDDPSSGIV